MATGLPLCFAAKLSRVRAMSSKVASVASFSETTPSLNTNRRRLTHHGASAEGIDRLRCGRSLPPSPRVIISDRCTRLRWRPSKNIAVDLGISQRTVENHRAAIMRKTGSKSLPAQARLALAAESTDKISHTVDPEASRRFLTNSQ